MDLKKSKIFKNVQVAQPKQRTCIAFHIKKILNRK